MNRKRKAVFEKFGGRCAYCGELLPEKGWHIDHKEPCVRSFKGGYDNPSALCAENEYPACASCNINKHSMSVEQFRASISKFVESLNKYSVQYKIAKRYGLISEIKQEVKFYFETNTNGQ